jgi:ATP-dependent exoDNAse (exonuclease V) alpha subunit
MTEYKNARSNKAKKLYIKKLSYDENSQDMILMEGMPLIARKGNDKLNICNNETFTIKTIDDETITIKDGDRNIDIDIDQISSLFYPAFCITVFKAQGQTYNEQYMIHEWDKFTDRMKYVALSRATNIDHIYIKI